jgi:hypothetical protein
MAGGIGPPLERAEVSDDGPDRRQQVTDGAAAVPHAVYTSVQMLEFRCKSLILSHFSEPSAGLAVGKARSATCYSIMNSDILRGRLGHPTAAWDGCTESFTLTSADCSLFQPAHMAPDAYELARRLTLPCGRGSDSAHSALSPGAPGHSALSYGRSLAVAARTRFTMAPESHE